MTTTQEVVDAYGKAWNEPDETERRRLLEVAWTDGGTFTDPQSDVAGRDALVAHIASFHQQFAGAQITPASGVDEHHGRVRFTWKMTGADGATIMEGIDFGELAADGRLQKIVGFFGPAPVME